MRYLFILLLGWLPMVAAAVDFDESTRTLPLGRTMQVLEDPSAAATIGQVVAAAKAGKLHTNTSDVLNAGYSTSAFWVRLQLRYQPTTAQAGVRHWLLELAYPPLDHVDLYLAGTDGRFQLAQRTGDQLPWASRPIRQNTYVFDLPFEPGQEKIVYLRVQSEGSVQVPLALWSPTAYLEDQPVRLYVLGMIYGVLLVMVVYNLFIYLSVRDTSYLYYILYIGSFGLYQVSVNGAGVEFLWPNNPWWANTATPFLIGAASFFGCQFTRSFLRTPQYSRWGDRLLKGLMAWAVLVMVLALAAGYALSLRLATALALVFTLMIFCTGALAWWRGLRQARYFMIAWTAFLLGGVVNTLMVIGLLPNMFLTMYASQLGSALEVALLSLALADRINQMREQQAQVLREASQKLEAMNQQLSVSNHLKDEFLATLTHELRTPMNGVIGSLELMQTVPMDAEMSQYQHTATHSARDMMRMIDDILTLSELQAGRLLSHNEPFRLRALLESLQMQYIGSAERKGLAFTVNVGPGLPERLCGDSKKLAMAIGCLLDNAIKFTARGGVTLAVESAGSDAQAVALKCSVADTGIGFDFSDEALYQRFYQLDGSTTREHGGLGIGLAICRQLVALLGGRLHHRSVPGEGSRFEIDIPLAQVQGDALPAPAGRLGQPIAHRPAQGCTVMLLDDQSIEQLLLRGMLLKWGYRVRTVEGLDAALALLTSEPVDVAILDAQALAADLAGTAQRLRQARPQAPPALVVLAGGNGQWLGLCEGAGLRHVLQRPVRFDELHAVLQGALMGEPAREIASA
ncbi:7TM diverse intracellular signaling domain-containing protein [Pseudomonas typographi]|uniref:histidine kinase n=1 Tax=Pseudomonas typographi TaxID=2715964 RepID=A0ABR7Z6N8_9PSED|nr:7TM diverse intracellular signaling domain-containing protein [Pseudomonas typographi]MBD1600966.1 hybrid sensor histidine kinase/response regulator [Pseudomonas typographi]